MGESTVFVVTGRKSPDGILTKAEFKSAFQCKSLQKIQEDENESEESNSDCIFAEEPSKVQTPTVKFNIDLPKFNTFSRITEPLIKNENMQIMPYQPNNFSNLSAAFPPNHKLDDPIERETDRKSPKSRTRITATTDTDLEMDL